MREVHALSSNCLASFNDAGEFVPQAEIILITTEPVYRLNGKGQKLERHREVQQFRFLARPEMLRALAEKLVKTAEASEKVFKGAMETIPPGDEPAAAGNEETK